MTIPEYSEITYRGETVRVFTPKKEILRSQELRNPTYAEFKESVDKFIKENNLTENVHISSEGDYGEHEVYAHIRKTLSEQERQSILEEKTKKAKKELDVWLDNKYIEAKNLVAKIEASK